MRWYRKAVDLNEPYATNNLAYLYEAGASGVAKDEAEAVRLYRKSAELGNTDALINLSVMLLNGRGAPKDEQEAVRLLRQGTGAQSSAGILRACQRLRAGARRRQGSQCGAGELSEVGRSRLF